MEEEQRCLDQVRDLFEQNKIDQPIAAAIIEPIQSEGGHQLYLYITMYSSLYTYIGDRHASPEFFRKLHAICIEVHGLYIMTI